jgi:hypothetical protein
MRKSMLYLVCLIKIFKILGVKMYVLSNIRFIEHIFMKSHKLHTALSKKLSGSNVTF